MTSPPEHGDAPTNPGSIFLRIGPDPIAMFAEELYARIALDQRIRGMFPSELGPESESVRDMREFLIQFLGGPADYSSRKGHPRLRARHLRFPIGPAVREAWLENALSALAAVDARFGLDTDITVAMRDYFVQASAFMMNRSSDAG
jgi:hemoglobin